jgi:hypothetical protein
MLHVATRGTAALLGLLVCAAPVRGAGTSVASTRASEALGACKAGRAATERTVREAHFTRGQQLAEQAIADDEKSAAAHFALFCNMGEIMRLDGESVSSVFSLRRLMAELDRTLVLDPTHADALAAKGTLLVRLPRLLGGNVRQGEELLRRAITHDPTAVSSRLTLAATCGARGDRDEAITFATRALQIAREQGRADKVAEAQAVLAELHASR